MSKQPKHVWIIEFTGDGGAEWMLRPKEAPFPSKKIAMQYVKHLRAICLKNGQWKYRATKYLPGRAK